MSMRIRTWLKKHAHAIGSRDGLPGDFHREGLFNLIQLGDTVGIVTPHGSLLCGRATIRNDQQQCFVLNGGGPHGTPLIADARNTIYVAGTTFKGTALQRRTSWDT